MTLTDKGHNVGGPLAPPPDEYSPPSSDFRQLFEAVPDPCLVLDTNLRIVSVNQAYLNATMTKREEILGRGIFEVFPDTPADPAANGVRNLSASLHRVLRDGVKDVMTVQKYDIRTPEEDGGKFEERYWSPANMPVFGADNKIIYIIHRVQDVTEYVQIKKRGDEEHKANEELKERVAQEEAEIYSKTLEVAEAIQEIKRLNSALAEHTIGLEQRVAEYAANLQESETRYRTLITATSDIVYRMNPDWSEMRQLQGKKFIEDTGEPNRNWLQQYIPEDDQWHVMTVINEAIQAKSIFELEHRVLRVDGTLGWIFSRAIPMLDAEGEIFEWFGAASDITGRKHLEEALENLNEALEKQVAERTAELETANLELEAFNYAAAHDLRQPLNQIALYSQTLQMQCGDHIPEECNAYIQGIYKSNLRMNRLIETLLNFSQTVRREPKQQSVDLYAMAHDVAMALKQSEPERQVNFKIANGITANVDADLLRVVLDNLFGNAWKYTSKRESGVIEFGLTKTDGKPVYYVRDNGIGFDNAAAGKLFVPFQRLPGAEAFGGFGIGLATVERIIRRHGGRIWAEGAPDKGATFYFTLSAD